jgi:hypothetical protein
MATGRPVIFIAAVTDYGVGIGVIPMTVAAEVFLTVVASPRIAIDFIL